MNTLIARLVIAAAAASAGAVAPAQDSDLSAQPPPSDYQVVKLSALGGTSNSGNSINDLALVAGYANQADDNSRHAMLWLYGFKFELGTLGGPNSNIPWPVKNTNGLIAGIAQTTTPQPLGETWSCRLFFAPATRAVATCRGVVWENGEIRALPTFGGDNGFATGANNKRHVVGWAENTVHDPSCVKPQVLRFRAAMWGPGKNQMRQLRPWHNDATSAATAINDKDQVVGISGKCGTAVGGFSAAHAVLWEGDTVTRLGDLGGIAWNTPMAINQRGDVVGFSNVSAADGDVFNAHAYVQFAGGRIRELRPLPGDSLGQALGINDRRQVVGLSCTAGFVSCRAFLWQNGVMTDLNELRQPGFKDQLYMAGDINNLGQIAGQAVVPGTENYSAFWAYPVPRRQGNSDAGAVAMAQARVKLPDNVRRALLERLGLSEASFKR